MNTIHGRRASLDTSRPPAARGALVASLAMILLILVLQPLSAWATWTQATGTSGIRFVSMSKIDTTLYAGALAGGLYQSTDDGASWTTAFGTTFDLWTPNVVTRIGGVLYVGGAKSGAAHLAYSTDSGNTWTDLTAWGGATSIRAIALMNGATFVAAGGRGVYKSTTNDGTGWTLSNTGMTTQSIPARFAQIGTVIFVADASNNGNDGVFKSEDDGANWTRVSTGLPATGSAVSGLLHYDGALYFAMGGGLWRSFDSGESWTLARSGGSYDFVNNNATLYLSGTSGLSLNTSTDGTTWTSQSLTGLTAPYLQPGIVLSGGKLLLASGDGIWREDDPEPSYALTITPPVNGSVASDIGGIACSASCSGYYVANASVTLTATADSGQVFSGWGGDCSGTSNPLVLVMTADMACGATFALANTAPVFVGATTTLTVAPSAGATGIAGLLHVSDEDAAQTLTWTEADAPGHGTLAIVGATAGSGGTDIAPGGTLTYTPTPGYVGPDSFTVQVSDGMASASRSIGVTVGPAPTVSVDALVLNAMTAGVPFVSQSFGASGGHGPYTYAVSAGALPDGLILDTASGALTGTPTSAGAYGFTIQATDSSTGPDAPFAGTRAFAGNVLPASAAQPGIATLTPGVTANLAVDGCANVDNAVFIAAPAGLPKAGFPYGLLDFTLSGCGATATVSIVYSQELPEGAVFYKLMGGQYDLYPATISGNTVTFTLTDNDPAADSDPTVGIIHDPSGVVVFSANAPIPSLSGWGMLMLAGLMAFLGLRHARQSERT